MHAALGKYAPSLGTKTNPFNQHAIQGYISGKLFDAAVKASGASDVTPETVKQGLYALKGETLGGLTVPLTYAAGKPSLFNCYYVTPIENGQMVAPDGLKPQCAPTGVVEALLQG
jgi:branched-chain amino acid transport system substrate-binding protein